MAWGVPLSVMLGRVVREGEPLWTEHDRDVALALSEYRDSLTPCCGVPKDVAYAIQNSFAFVAEKYSCHVCRAREEAGSDLSHKAREHPEWMHGARFEVFLDPDRVIPTE